MKNPLTKRLPKELIGEIGKYLVIFLFMTATIAFISGFLVAGESMIHAYNESFDKYNVEDGNFELDKQADNELVKTLEKENVQIYNNFYKEEDTTYKDKNSVLRIFLSRDEINIACIMEGSLPKEKNEIAVDRMYADNNNISVGDNISVGSQNLVVSGLIALPDYSALFSDNSDMMFDAVKFGVAVMTKEGFETLSESNTHYSYSWQYDEEPADDIEAKEMSDDFMTVLNSNATIENYIPAYENQAIQFTGNDFGNDHAMMLILLYILIVIMAFVFAVTTSNTVSKESAVIGTLRASGYSRGELIRHYMALPMLVTLLSCIIGNILGYTVFKNIVASMYYESYSLPTYHTRWNAQAFILTTLVPAIIMIVINFLVLYRSLKHSPLQFLRQDLGTRKRKKAVALPNFKFLTRFRIRIIFQNMPNYLTLFIGIIFANVLLIFGLMMMPLLNNYQDEIIDKMISDYQYILMAPVETNTTGAEEYCISSLTNVDDRKEDESISVYGIKNDSKYIDINIPDDGVFISNGYAEKYSLSIGDEITLKENYGTKKYHFTIKGLYDYPASLAVFMSQTEYNEVFDQDADYFNGYFSNEKITDIDNVYVASIIKEDDLTKVSRQLDVSMGEMFYMINIFAVILYMLLIYLLSKLIIEKNATSISMVKILGYENSEISKLYLMSTSIIVVLSILLSLPIDTWIINTIYVQMMMSFSGWLTPYIAPSVYAQMIVLGIVTYGVIAVLQFKKIQKIPLEQALKIGE